MEIIKRGFVPSIKKRLKCDFCSTIFEFTKKECNITSQLGRIHDGLPMYNVNCPYCRKLIYFDWNFFSHDELWEKAKDHCSITREELGIE